MGEEKCQFPFDQIGFGRKYNIGRREVLKVDILDVLLDEENKEPIVLVDDQGKNYAFDQIAIIPYNDKIYAVLKPITEMANVRDDEAIVFYVDESGDKTVLRVELNERIAIDVFNEYYDLLEKSDEEV